MSHKDEVGARVQTPFSYPMWLLVDTKGLEERGLPSSVAVFGGQEFMYFIPLFTSADKAKRLLEVAALTDQSPLAVGTAHVLGAILNDFYRRGIYAMAVDLHFPAGEDSPIGVFFEIKSYVEYVFGKS
jgi:hypothetical protein